jgi:hypothetical protein
MVLYVIFEAIMKISDIVLDTVAEIAALDSRLAAKNAAIGLEEVLFALCHDSGASFEELRLDLESRVIRIRAERSRLRMMARED